jgi:transposase InsO family protein
MTSSTRTQQRYDHRLRRLIQTTGDLDLAVSHGVPRSTARGWLKNSGTDVVSIDALDMDTIRLQQEVAILRRRVTRLLCLLQLIVVALKVSDFSFDRLRIPENNGKRRLLRAIERVRSHLALRRVLSLIGMSRTRYHAWIGKQECGLNDRSCCPKSSPQELTQTEVNTIRGMVTSDEFRHVPTGTLARLAQRLSKVFASPTTWYRLVRTHKWRRPRLRVYPAKPKIGIRASRANEVWHVDTTLIRLLDGSRVYLHAVIDNFSRRILAWMIAERFHPAITAQLLLDASKSMTSGQPMVLVDGGVENFNSAVDEVIESGLLKRVLAQTEITFSNSLIESWWRVLKHQWLYLNTLDTVATVRKLVAFYVEQHNNHLPHSAFRGQTPDEMYFGTGADIPQQLEAAHVAARASRLKANREQRCQLCTESEKLVSLSR